MQNVKIFLGIAVFTTLFIKSGFGDPPSKDPNKSLQKEGIVEKTLPATSVDHDEDKISFDKQPQDPLQPAATTPPKSTPEQEESAEKDPANSFTYSQKLNDPDNGDYPAFKSLTNQSTKEAQSIVDYGIEMPPMDYSKVIKEALKLEKKDLNDPFQTDVFHRNKKNQVARLEKIRKSFSTIEAANAKADKAIRATVKIFQKTISDEFKDIELVSKTAPTKVKDAIKQFKKTMYDKINTLQTTIEKNIT